MSEDHKPEDDLERSRIEKAGGKVTADGRVNGGLNLSRAIGNFTLLSFTFFKTNGILKLCNIQVITTTKEIPSCPTKNK